MRRVALMLLLLCNESSADSLEVWKCSPGGYFTNSNVVLTAKVNKDKTSGVLEVAGTVYDTHYLVEGFNRKWIFGERGDGMFRYTLMLAPAGNAYYFDFGNKGIEAESSQSYGCKQF